MVFYAKLNKVNNNNNNKFLSPKHGTAGKTFFRIECSRWKNDDKPLHYEFRYDKFDEETIKINNVKGKELPLLNPTSLSQSYLHDVLLPAGLKSYNYTINLQIRVVNKYGAFSTHDKINVTVSLYPHYHGNSK